MSRTVIYKGDDKTIRLSITENGVAYDLTAVQGYIIYLYYAKGNKILKKYSKNVIEGFDTLSEVDAAGGVVDIYLQKADTKEAAIGDIDLEVKIQTENLEFDENTFHTITREVEVLTIKESVSKNVTSLD